MSLDCRVDPTLLSNALVLVEKFVAKNPSHPGGHRLQAELFLNHCPHLGDELVSSLRSLLRCDPLSNFGLSTWLLLCQNGLASYREFVCWVCKRLDYAPRELWGWGLLFRGLKCHMADENFVAYPHTDDLRGHLEWWQFSDHHLKGVCKVDLTFLARPMLLKTFEDATQLSPVSPLNSADEPREPDEPHSFSASLQSSLPFSISSLASVVAGTSQSDDSDRQVSGSCSERETADRPQLTSVARARNSSPNSNAALVPNFVEMSHRTKSQLLLFLKRKIAKLLGFKLS